MVYLNWQNYRYNYKIEVFLFGILILLLSEQFVCLIQWPINLDQELKKLVTHVKICKDTKNKLWQFFRSLANNIRTRLFTFQASNTARASSSNTFKNKFEELLKDIEVLEPKSWPDNCDIQFGDKNVRRLTAEFQVDEISTIQGFREYKDTRVISSISSLKPLLVSIKTIAISSSECERSFSAMNNTVTSKRNSLTTQHISSLLFIQCVGPPVIDFNATNYVKSWILNGRRDANELCCPKRKETKSDQYSHLWKLLNED